jgi:hypothetical protein
VHFFTAPLDGFTFLSKTLLSKPEFHRLAAMRKYRFVVSPILAIATFTGLNSMSPCWTSNCDREQILSVRSVVSECKFHLPKTSVSFFVNLFVNHYCCVTRLACATSPKRRLSHY